MRQTAKYLLNDITQKSNDHHIGTITQLRTLARDKNFAVTAVGPNVGVSLHGVNQLSQVELSTTINELELHVGDQLAIQKIDDRYIAYAHLAVSQRYGSPGISYGRGNDVTDQPAPTDLTATIAGKWLKLQWSPVPGATTYQVIRSSNRNPNNSDAVVLTDTAATGYETRHQGADADPGMWYAVVARSRRGKGSVFSDWVQPTVSGAAEAAFLAAQQLTAVPGYLIVTNGSGTVRTDFKSFDTPTPFIVELNDPTGTHPTFIANNSVLHFVGINGNSLYVKVTGHTDKKTYWQYKCTKLSPGAHTQRNIKAGSTYVNYGTGAGGFLFLLGDDSYDGNAPYYSVRTYTDISSSNPVYSTPVEVVRLGNLNGFTDYASDVYGLGIGLDGVNNSNITIDPTNGIRIRSNHTNILQFDMSGNAFILGTLTMSTFGVIRSGKTSYADTTAGYWLEANSGTPRFSIGGATDSLTWNGTTLTVSGTLNVTGNSTFSGNILLTGTIQSSNSANTGFKLSSTGLRTWNSSNVQTVEINADGSGWFGLTGTRAISWTTAGTATIGGFTATASQFSAGSGGTRVALDSGGSNPAFWAGSDTATSAPIQIYNSGYIFAEDIVLAKGTLSGASGATGYGYAVNPLMLLHFDGAFPYFTDLRGSTSGAGGEVGTYTWSATVGFGTFFKGLYGKAVAVAEATTNHVKNPSAEGAGNFGSQGASTTSIVTSVVLFGTHAFQVVLGGANQGLTLTTDALANAIHYVTFWVEGGNSTTYQVSLDNTNWNTPTLIETYPTSATTWRRYGVSIPAAQANGSTTTRLRNTASSGTQRIDAIQVEQKTYPTPYCDGAVGLFPGQARSASAGGTTINGYQWTGTEDASTSARVAATLTYPFSGNMLLNQGSLSFWVLIPPVQAAPSLAFGMYIDANNYIGVKLAPAGATGKIVGESASGGVAVDTSSGASTAAVGWHHVAMTWTTGHQKVWVDGVQSGADVSYVAPAGTATTIEIGSKNLTQQCNTIIDDFCIVADVLTDHEIKSIFYSDAPLMIAISNQEFRLSDPAGGEVWGNANGIFGKDDDGQVSFALVNLSTPATYWGSSSGATYSGGSLLLGSDASTVSNLCYRQDIGSLDLRYGTTPRIRLDTNGSLLMGSNVSSGSTTSFGVLGQTETIDTISFDASDLFVGRPSQGHVWWDNSATTLFFANGSTKRISLDTNGTILVGSDITAANTTGLVVFSSSITYNGEASTFAAGDVLLGSNSSGKGNVWYDVSAGALFFRTATTKKISLDTSGNVYVGSDITSHTTTGLVVLSTGITYNGESLSAGNVLIGDNSVANLLYDGGTFHGRTGTTDYATFGDTYGFVTWNNAGFAADAVSVTVGSGNIELDMTTCTGVNGNSMTTSLLVVTSATGNWTVKSIAKPASGQALILVVLWTSTGHNVTVPHAPSSPSTGYSLVHNFAVGDLTSSGDCAMMFIYNTVNTRWDLVSIRSQVGI